VALSPFKIPPVDDFFAVIDLFVLKNTLENLAILLNPDLPLHGLPYRRIEQENCEWAVTDKNWFHQGGGTRDTAKTIAKILDRSWQFMRDGKDLEYRLIGKFGDRHFCVGTTDGPDCLLEKAEQVTGTNIESLMNYDASMSSAGEANWSNWGGYGFVQQFDATMVQSELTFSFRQHDPTMTKIYDMILDTSTVDAQDNTKRLTDTLVTAFTAGLSVQVRTEGESFIVRDVRLDPPDDDGDLILDEDDNCPTIPNPDQFDGDDDGVGNACDICPLDPNNDEDGDGLCGPVDNCPLIANPDQADNEQDGLGNACDIDDDDDGILDPDDNCPLVENPLQINTDSDSIGNACDPDDDNDSVPDDADECPLVDAAGFDVDNNGCIDSTVDLLELISEYVTGGNISGHLQESLSSKVVNATKSQKKQNYCAAVNQLKAFQKQISAQRGKKLTEDAASNAIDFSASVIANMESKLADGKSCD
jgi:hypothetical protein